MFKRKKKEEPAEGEVKIYQKPKVTPTVQVQQQQAVVPERQVEGKARIIAAEVTEAGLFRYVFISNKMMGNIGEEFPVD